MSRLKAQHKAQIGQTLWKHINTNTREHLLGKGSSYLFLFSHTYTHEYSLFNYFRNSDDDYVFRNLHKLVGALNAFYNLPFMVNDSCRGILK